MSTDETKNSTQSGSAVAQSYAALLPIIRNVAREEGYAIGLHGSMTRDLDLIAAPWVEEASAPMDLALAIKNEVGTYLSSPVEGPHGRWTIHIHLAEPDPENPYIDLSIMKPRAA